MSQLVTSEVSERFPSRKRWTRKDCHFLERVGLLTDSYELIDGEIINKMGQNRPHIMAISRVFAWLIAVFGVEFVQTQGDIEVSQEDRTFNHPQPDVAVLSRPDHTFDQEPTGKELQLAVEVSDSTLRGDLNIKANLYARAGIPEYWVLDVTSRSLFIHRTPADGAYGTVERFSESESVSTKAAPQNSVTVANLLPPISAEAS